MSEQDTRDRGAVVVLSLVLCVILGMVAVGLAGYAAVALRSSRVTDVRSGSREAAEAGLRIAVERVKAGWCAETGGPVPTINGATVEVSCTVIATGPSDYRTLRIDATARVGSTQTRARAQVEDSMSRGWVAINSWEVLSR